MSVNPFLSIVIPVYNAESYLPCCLDSILAQQFTDYEVILVDDGSTDRSPAICDAYAAGHSQIHCLHQANGGHTAARQTGVRASLGTYIAFVDSDDWIAPEMYARMCTAARDTGADIVHCNYTSVMPHKEKICGIPFPSGFYDKKRLMETVYPNMIYFGTFFVFGIAPNLWNKLFRRSLLERCLFRIPHDIVVGEDGPVTYSCMLEAESVFFCDEAYYYYRSNDSSLCHQMDVKRLIENHSMFETYERLIVPAARPFMQKQLHYFFVYQSLLTFVPVFRTIRETSGDFRRLFLEECDNPYIRTAFKAVPLKDITGLHNKLYAACIRCRLSGLFKLLL